MPTTLPCRLLRTDGGTQPRAELHGPVVDDYREAMGEGAVFPPLVVFHDGASYWLADGFHRLQAAKELDRTEIAVELHQGSQRDAILYSCGANAQHGLARSNEDKRRAVDRLLTDPEWGRWSDHEIARRAAVTHRMVGRRREELFPPTPTQLTGEEPRSRLYIHNRTGRATVMSIPPPPARAPTPAPGHREPKHAETALRVANTLDNIRRAMAALPPRPLVAVAAVPTWDRDEAERISLWWEGFLDGLDQRAERAS